MSGDITRILATFRQDGPAALAELLPIVYAELKRIAERKMRQERPEHTLSPTALVHEAYLKLLGNERIDWRDRGHFFDAAAESMRRILVDRARGRGRWKRGGGLSRVPLSVVDLAQEDDGDVVLALNEALDRLEAMDPRLARVVKLRFFSGLSVEETAAAMDLSPRTVKRQWLCARAWLFQELGGEP